MPVVGLDLGRHNFRAVELTRDKNGIVLNKFRSYENPKLNLESATKEDITAYAAAVREFFNEVGFESRGVVVSLPEYQVFMRVIKLPEMSDKDLKNSIPYQAEQYIPMPSKEVDLAYQKIDSDYDTKGKMNVLLVAAKKTISRAYVEILKEAKLTPRGLEPEALAIGRSLGDTIDHPTASVIVNIGVGSTLIIITYRGFVRFTRSVPVGGEILTRSVQQALGLDQAQAEEYKKAYGLDSNYADGKIFNALKPVFDNVVMEIRRSNIFFTTHNPNVTINRVILSGGTALMPGLLFYMATNLDMEVELANPWRNITLSPKLESQKDKLLEQGPAFATTVGLALKELQN